MNILTLSLGEIHPYGKNPRKNDKAVDAVAESIRQYGFLVPLVISKEYEIIAGHTRYKAARKLGLAKVPCVIADELTVFCQVLFPEKSVEIPFFQQGIFPAFSGHYASLRMRACSIR